MMFASRFLVLGASLGFALNAKITIYVLLARERELQIVSTKSLDLLADRKDLKKLCPLITQVLGAIFVNKSSQTKVGGALSAETMTFALNV